MRFDISADQVAREAIARKTVTPYSVYQTLPDDLKRRAFAVAGIESQQTLEHLHRIVKELPVGTDWLKARKRIANVLLGRPENSRLYKRNEDDRHALARARHIVNLHGLQAYGVGRYAQQTELAEAFPFWRYQSSDDGRVRPRHQQLHGLILPFDDPFWETHYPPWEWGCRCMVVPLTARQAENLGAVNGRLIPEGVNLTDMPPESGYRFDPSEGLAPKDTIQSTPPEAPAITPENCTAIENLLPNGRRLRLQDVLDALEAKSLDQQVGDLTPSSLRIQPALGSTEMTQRLGALGFDSHAPWTIKPPATQASVAPVSTAKRLSEYLPEPDRPVEIRVTSSLTPSVSDGVISIPEASACRGQVVARCMTELATQDAQLGQDFEMFLNSPRALWRMSPLQCARVVEMLRGELYVE